MFDYFSLKYVNIISLNDYSDDENLEDIIEKEKNIYKFYENQ